MLPVVGSLLFWGVLVASCIALYPIALLLWATTVLFDRRLAVLHQFTCLWASLYTWMHPRWRLRIVGRQHMRPGVAYVMVSNHQSFLDILVLFRLFRHFKWVSKAEMFRIPCLGWNMTLNRYVKLRRGDPASIATMMHACETHLRNGSPVMMFPEGTRSADGRLKPFKHGAFTLAKRAGVPILPIVLEGTAHALPKHGFVMRGRHTFRIRVLEPIPASAFADIDVETLTTRVHALYARELGQAITPHDDVPAVEPRA